MKYVVICYAEHENEIESKDIFNGEKEALNCMERDFSLKLDEEEMSTPEEEIDNIYSEINEADAYLSSWDGEMSWVWKILSLNNDDVEQAEDVFMDSLEDN